MSSENISLPNQTFPTTQGEINLADVSAEWLGSVDIYCS